MFGIGYKEGCFLMLERREVLQMIFKKIKKEKAIAITTTGLIGREAFELVGYNKHFYMAGSMGLTASIGLGIALSKPKVKVIAIEGDGSFLLNLEKIITIGCQKPKNLVHIVLDNGVYYSTGGMKTYSSYVSLENLTKIAGYKISLVAKNKTDLQRHLNTIFKKEGPIFIRVLVKPTGKKKLPRPKKLERFYFKLKEVLKEWE